MSEDLKRFVIAYHYGTYEGTEVIYAEDGEQAINKMWHNFRREGLLTLTMASESARIIEGGES